MIFKGLKNRNFNTYLSIQVKALSVTILGFSCLLSNHESLL